MLFDNLKREKCLSGKGSVLFLSRLSKFSCILRGYLCTEFLRRESRRNLLYSTGHTDSSFVCRTSISPYVSAEESGLILSCDCLPLKQNSSSTPFDRNSVTRLCESHNVTRLCESHNVTRLCESHNVTRLCESYNVTRLCESHNVKMYHQNFGPHISLPQIIAWQ
jgi:hypothetical protein